MFTIILLMIRISKDISLIEPDAIVIPKPNFNQSETFFGNLRE